MRPLNYAGTASPQINSQTLTLKVRIQPHSVIYRSSPYSWSLLLIALNLLIDFGIGKSNLFLYSEYVQIPLNFSAKIRSTSAGAFLINITPPTDTITTPKFAASSSLTAAVYCSLFMLRKCLGPLCIKDRYVLTGDTHSSIPAMMFWCIFDVCFVLYTLALWQRGVADVSFLPCKNKHEEAIIDELN